VILIVVLFRVVDDDDACVGQRVCGKGKTLGNEIFLAHPHFCHPFFGSMVVFPFVHVHSLLMDARTTGLTKGLYSRKNALFHSAES